LEGVDAMGLLSGLGGIEGYRQGQAWRGAEGGSKQGDQRETMGWVGGLNGESKGGHCGRRREGENDCGLSG